MTKHRADVTDLAGVDCEDANDAKDGDLRGSCSGKVRFGMTV